MPFRIALALSIWGLMSGPAHAEEPASAPASAPALTYEQHVRPIFKAYCFQCHGDEPKINGALDLRLRRFLITGGDSGAAIVPGDPDNSLLIERLQSGEMPPGEGKPSAKDIETIVQWVRQGAPTARAEPETITGHLFTEEERTFWSFQPIQQPALPAVKDAARVRTAVDAFLLAKLEQQNLSFSPEADRLTLLRRASFDLLGLPPTPEEIDAFLADESPDAYERLLDRLLDSPRYGERWGRHWLDVAGYADSEGYTDADPVRKSAFRYRDYVIRSFNADKPFDEFIQEQLAGDEMVALPYENLTPDQADKLIATGFLRMAPDGTADGSVDQVLARNHVVAETLKIVSTSLMGMTVGCAECHNHRYDPIPTADYYSMRAVFEPALNVKQWRTPAARHISMYTAEDRRIAAEREAEAKAVEAERRQTTQEFIDDTLEYQLAKLTEDLREPLRAAYKTAAAMRTPEQKDLLARHPSIQQISPGSLYLYDRELQVAAAAVDKDRQTKERDYVEQAFAAELEKIPAETRAAVRTARDIPADKRTPEQSALLTQHAAHVVTLANLATFRPEQAQELAALKEQADKLRASVKAPRLKEYDEKIAAIRSRKPPEGFIRALTEIPGQVPPTFVFFRGDHEQPKEEVPPGSLSILADPQLFQIPPRDPALPTTGRRLAFARQLTNGAHPLTARVLINRVWLNHFGRGIVDTPGDFGFLGSRPTHPELLDWLARDFMAGGWQLKRMHKLLMTSTAYRQASRRTPPLDAVDPDNKLYGRMSIRRLEAETVRDAVLAVSGQLNAKMFGEPVPVMEDEVGQIVIGQENLDGERKPGKAIPLQGEEFRRSLYVQVRRSRLLGVLDTFDAPTMDPNCTIRNASTVAPQALMLMNSRFSVEHSQAFAARVRELAGDDPQAQAKAAWKLAFGRPMSDAETEASVKFLTQQLAYHREHRPPAMKEPPELLSLANFCQALISSNGFLYVD